MPTPPRDLEYSDPATFGNMFNITLTWNRPDPPNGLIIQYNVSDATYSYYLDYVYCHRYLILVQPQVLLYRIQLLIMMFVHLIHGLV